MLPSQVSGRNDLVLVGIEHMVHAAAVMSALPSTTETIAAIATAVDGAVGIVRISGASAETVARRCFLGLPERPASHRLYHGRVVNAETGEVLDEALAVIMRGPNSFTGEDVAELQCHGGAQNLSRVLAAALAAGARPAEAGEFSLRAFLNGRIDLTRAEAIADVVSAESDEALRVAQAQLGGALAAPIERLRGELLELLTLLEASLDFAGEEHVYQLPADEVRERIAGVSETIERMLAAHETGRIGLSGARVVLVGEPNAGKSSLFNRLVGLDRAIVTDVPGTTRDTLEETTAFAGQRLRLVDTAGLRDADDEVERIGVERSHAQLRSADLLLWLVDATRDENAVAVPSEVASRPPSDVIVVASKVDLVEDESGNGARARGAGRRQRAVLAESISSRLPAQWRRADVVTTSAETGEGLVALQRAVAEHLARVQARSEDDVPLVTSLRHVAALRESFSALERAASAIESGLPLELASADVRDASESLGRIVGAIATDEVLAGIFSRFCVGK